LRANFFDKRVGLAAVILLLMCFPFLRRTSSAATRRFSRLAFMLLVFLYTPLAVERLGYLTVAFFVAFGLVLSHQLAMFLQFSIMPPILLYMLIKSRGKHFKVVLALLFRWWRSVFPLLLYGYDWLLGCSD